MSKHIALEKMREAYRLGDVVHLKKLYLMGNWMLTDEERSKISAAINQLEETPPIKPASPLVEEALRVLGGRIVS